MKNYTLVCEHHCTNEQLIMRSCRAPNPSSSVHTISYMITGGSPMGDTRTIKVPMHVSLSGCKRCASCVACVFVDGESSPHQ